MADEEDESVEVTEGGEDGDEVDGEDDEEEEAPPGLDGGDDDDGDSSDDEKPPPKETLYQKMRSFVKGTAQPATTYGPPYLLGHPKIDQTLIDECDMGEPSVKDVHAILNEGVNPDVVDKGSYNDTAMIKLGRHCYTAEGVNILEKLVQAGAHVNKCNMLGITPLHRACMARPPKGPPEEWRLNFLQWLCDNKGEINAIDKGGFTPMYHAAANNDVAACRLLMRAGASVRPNLSCKNPVDAASSNGNRKLEFILDKQATAEEVERKRQKLEKDKAMARAAEHRRKLALRMEENLQHAKGGVAGPKYKLEKLSEGEMKAHARSAYAKAQEDGRIAAKRKDAEREKQVRLLRTQEAKFGVWKRSGKMRYRFEEQKTADAEEETRTMALGQSLYDDITFGPQEKQLRLRWREKTGLSRRDALPALKTIPDPLPKKKKHSDSSRRDTPFKMPERGQKSKTLVRNKRTAWLSYPGALEGGLETDPGLPALTAGEKGKPAAAM